MQRLIRRSGRRGVVTVEMAMVAPLLIFLLFAIVEFGVLVRNVVSINEGAREGTRAAAVGAVVTTIEARTYSALSGLDPGRAELDIEYRSWDHSSGSWGAWKSLTNSGAVNSALAGDQIRVRVEYPHQIMITGLFGSWASNDGNDDGIMTLNASTIMRRE